MTKNGKKKSANPLKPIAKALLVQDGRHISPSPKAISYPMQRAFNSEKMAMLNTEQIHVGKQPMQAFDVSLPHQRSKQIHNGPSTSSTRGSSPREPSSQQHTTLPLGKEANTRDLGAVGADGPNGKIGLHNGLLWTQNPEIDATKRVQSLFFSNFSNVLLPSNSLATGELWERFRNYGTRNYFRKNYYTSQHGSCVPKGGCGPNY